MNAKQEVEDYIHTNWLDRVVAQWVIRQLELLTRANISPTCPVYILSLTEGLQRTDTQESPDDFVHKPKLVTSGGYEGVRGHIRLINELHEIRALTTNGPSELSIVLLLEPDSYIQNKGREPLVKLDQRAELWATSGLVDAVMLLPEATTNLRVIVTQLFTNSLLQHCGAQP